MRQGYSSSSGTNAPTVEIIVEIRKNEVRIWEKINEQTTFYASGSSFKQALQRMTFTYHDGKKMAMEAYGEAMGDE